MIASFGFRLSDLVLAFGCLRSIHPFAVHYFVVSRVVVVTIRRLPLLNNSSFSQHPSWWCMKPALAFQPCTPIGCCPHSNDFKIPFLLQLTTTTLVGGEHCDFMFSPRFGVACILLTTLPIVPCISPRASRICCGVYLACGVILLATYVHVGIGIFVGVAPALSGGSISRFFAVGCLAPCPRVPTVIWRHIVLWPTDWWRSTGW